jgi:hypothetical protein
MSGELVYLGITGIAAMVAPEFSPFILLGGGLLFLVLYGD